MDGGEEKEISSMRRRGERKVEGREASRERGGGGGIEVGGGEQRERKEREFRKYMGKGGADDEKG